MKEELNIGILGDYNPQKPSHPATNEALNHAAHQLSVKMNITWLPTPSLTDRKELWNLSRFDGLWAAPGDPQSSEGAILAIKQARLFDLPFIGT